MDSISEHRHRGKLIRVRAYKESKRLKYNETVLKDKLTTIKNRVNVDHEHLINQYIDSL